MAPFLNALRTGFEAVPWGSVVSTGVTLVVGGLGALLWRYYLFDAPRVRVRAHLLPVLDTPVVRFILVNTRKDEVHITSVMGLREKRGEKPVRFLVPTKPIKFPTLRLKGLERETFEAAAEDAFPDSYAVSEITGFYVEDVTKPERRWWAPKQDVEQIKKAAQSYLSRRREMALWVLVCQSCGGTVMWHQEHPKPTKGGGYSYNSPSLEQVPELEGWEPGDFPYLPATRGKSLCPGCSTEAKVKSTAAK